MSLYGSELDEALEMVFSGAGSIAEVAALFGVEDWKILGNMIPDRSARRVPVMSAAARRRWWGDERQLR